MMLWVALLPLLSIAQTKGKVIKVKDGDTIVVLLEGNVQKTLRLAEVDCPESKQAFGTRAKQYTSSQVFGKVVSFKVTNTDRYGRSIAKVYYGNHKYLSKEIIKAGMGWWYSKYSDNPKLGEFEKIARQNKLGLWQDKRAIAPWEFRKLKKEERAKYAAF